MEITDRGKAFRDAIARFIDERRDAKLNGKDDPAIAAKYAYQTWINETAEILSQVQLTTHPLKATYPDAKIDKTTSPFVQGCELQEHREVGSHLIKERMLDVTGNSALLGRAKLFVEVEVEGEPLIYWSLRDDPDFVSALHSDAETASRINAKFKRFDRRDQVAQSHEGAKQLFWLTGDDPADNQQFHLLQPMFSSSLEHVVHAEIQDARFGDANKAARQAQRDGKPHDTPYRHYPNLVERKLGGTKPQNISQLNSERGGRNYLLASLPPTWKSASLGKFTRTEALWKTFRRQRSVRQLLDELITFLKSDPPANVVTRRRREGLEQALGAQLVTFADHVHAARLPGWTRDDAGELPLSLQLWLDPGRLDAPPSSADAQAATDDEVFRQTYHQGDWPGAVADHFANWLNDQLRQAGLVTVGDADYRHWAKQAIVEAAWPVPMHRRAPVQPLAGVPA